jgi:hypothetical protein
MSEQDPQYLVLDDPIMYNMLPDLGTVRTRRREKTMTRQKNRIIEYMSGKYTLDDVYKEILEKKSKLSSADRKYVMDHYDEDGIFLYDKEVD